MTSFHELDPDKFQPTMRPDQQCARLIARLLEYQGAEYKEYFGSTTFTTRSSQEVAHYDEQTQLITEALRIKTFGMASTPMTAMAAAASGGLNLSFSGRTTDRVAVTLQRGTSEKETLGGLVESQDDFEWEDIVAFVIPEDTDEETDIFDPNNAGALLSDIEKLHVATLLQNMLDSMAYNEIDHEGYGLHDGGPNMPDDDYSIRAKYDVFDAGEFIFGQSCPECGDLYSICIHLPHAIN